MIRSYRDKETEKVATGKFSKKFSAIAPKALIRINILDSAQSLRDFSLPGLRLEKLSRDRDGQYSIRINDQYRICFHWHEGDAYEVEIVDYH